MRAVRSSDQLTHPRPHKESVQGLGVELGTWLRFLFHWKNSKRVNDPLNDDTFPSNREVKIVQFVQSELPLPKTLELGFLHTRGGNSTFSLSLSPPPPLLHTHWRYSTENNNNIEPEKMDRKTAREIRMCFGLFTFSCKITEKEREGVRGRERMREKGN